MNVLATRHSRLAFGVTMGTAAQLASIGLLLTASWLIVRAAQHPPVLYLMVAIVGVRFFGIARSVLRYVERLYTHDVALGDAVEQRVAAYRELDRVAPAGLGDLRRGDVVSRVVADVARLQDRLLRVRVPWWVGAAAAACVVLLVSWLDPRSGLVTLAGVVVAAVALRSIVARAGRGGRAERLAAQGRMSAEVAAAVLAARELVAYGAAEAARERVGEAARQAGRAQASGAQAGGLGAAIVLAVTGVTVAVLAAASAGVDPVLVGVIVLAPIAMAEPMDGWAEAERVRPELDAATDRLNALAALPTPVVDPADPQPLPASTALEVEDLVVGWDAPLTPPISFRLAAGDVVALTGPSGVGKSTLAYTLLRLLPPLGGSIRLGGVPVERLRAQDVRGVVGYLGQDDAVFDTTIRENLRVADPAADDEQMRRALASAGLAETLAELPEGLDTPVGEHGGRLSGGERQRLCLARLLLGDHRVLVLDEPTEHLDAPTAAALLDDVLALAGASGRSLIVISHAPAVLARFDRVTALAP